MRSIPFWHMYDAEKVTMPITITMSTTMPMCDNEGDHLDLCYDGNIDDRPSSNTYHPSLIGNHTMFLVGDGGDGDGDCDGDGNDEDGISSPLPFRATRTTHERYDDDDDDDDGGGDHGDDSDNMHESNKFDP